ncbi:sulfotransferase family 2 domain-containing protein [Aurantibacter sp.]|uniref:sulfotransferase family 2 domain-containing protein n=1 Tax=Aurantibacter sp. TaxID=2807103 RepID=UPI0035C87BE6
MINHEHKVIFIHVPKCAGSSVFKFFNKDLKVSWRTPNYNVLYGWCPKRKIHLQHATTKQLIETELITEEQWNSYYKFTIVRNPWDRAYSDYQWIMKDTGKRDSFKNFILKKGKFSKVLNDVSVKEYRGDHLLNQTDFFDSKGEFKLDFVGRFENLKTDFSRVLKALNISEEFSNHEKKSVKKMSHYSDFYTSSYQKLVLDRYQNDVEHLDYAFEDRKKGIFKIKNFF